MYLGNSPALNYTSLATQTFTTVTGQTQYTLDHSVANGNDILLYISNVKQVEGGSNSYTATGNTLTLNTAISAGTEMYCLFVSVARESITPPNASVGTSQLASSLDLSSKTVTLASNMTNAPAFEAHLSSNQTLTDEIKTKVQFDNEIFDTDNAYDNSTNYRFTPQVSGKYFVYGDINVDPGGTSQLSHASINIYKNGSVIRMHEVNFNTNYARRFNVSITQAIDMNGSSDYLEIFAFGNDTSGNPILNTAAPKTNLFGAYKLIGI